MFFKEIQEIKEVALKPELLKNVNVDRSIDIDRPLVGLRASSL